MTLKKWRCCGLNFKVSRPPIISTYLLVPAPGEQSQLDRYSIVYFVRPVQDTLMVPFYKFLVDGQSTVQVGGKVGDDNIYTAGEWIQKRYRSMGA